MTNKRTVEIRLDLARGHLALGELDFAVTCVQRAIHDDPDHPGIVDLARQLALAGRDRQDVEIVANCRAMIDRVEQIQRRKEAAARSSIAPVPVAAGPSKVALAQIARLEAWLSAVRSRYRGGLTHDVP